MIESTKASLLLKGFRGKPPADIDALISAMVKISHFAASHSDQLQEMDINPILVFPKGEGILALDAVLVVNKIV
jgi:acyl-CoA synthetase (NDP forming)